MKKNTLLIKLKGFEMRQTKEQRDAIIAQAVATAKEHTAELNAGPMKHTLRRRAALESKANKRR